MRVAVFPGDNQGVGMSRMWWPAEACRAQGLDVETRENLPIIRATRKVDGRQVIAPDEIDADVLVFQRPSNPEIVALIPAFQARGQAVVVDCDDLIGHEDSANRARHGENPRLIRRACALADVCTVSTLALARSVGARGNAIVLENCVPARLLDMPRSSDGRTVGWGGWVGTHPHDLQVTRGGVAQAVREGGARFKVIGPGDGVQRALTLDEEPEQTGGLPVVAYHAALGTLDVGIAPLADTAFNAAKSWLKPLEMIARGVAVVASPRAEYAQLADEGLCVLAADRARNWRREVAALLADETRRAEMVGRGRAIVRERHTFETQGWRWAEAWEFAWQRRQAKATVAA